ncbi:MAG: zf-HC2 domain-containing protein [Burkholderiales bacterium]|nr:zf-HC2 domain-containing protein [Burkholderiales bacterium]
MRLRRTCKEAAALIVAREDRALSLADRAALRLHFLACKTCPVFARQMESMRAAFARWRAAPPDVPGGGPDAR